MFEETLEETIIKQNLRGGLTHINDKCFEFFEFLESKIGSLLSFDSLMKKRENLFEFALDSLQNDKDILNHFIELYCVTRTTVEENEEDTSDDNIVLDVVRNTLTETVCNLENILKFSLNLFLKAAVAQFRKNYLNVLKIEKSKALRTKIMKQAQKKTKPININDIHEDKSKGKEISKLKLTALAMEDHEFYSKFTKQELKDMDKLYGLSFNTNKTLRNNGETVLKAILENKPQSLVTTEVMNDDVSSKSVSSEKNKDQLMQPTQSPCQQSFTAELQPDPVQIETEKSDDKPCRQQKKRSKSTYSKGGKGKSVSCRRKKRKVTLKECNRDEERVFCSVCGKFTQDNEDCICCDECDSWYHRCCVGLEDEKLWDDLTSEDSKYSCPLCS